jgi:leader peptidase (prepilin peptidase) / N-methyltransferase
VDRALAVGRLSTRVESRLQSFPFQDLVAHCAAMHTSERPRVRAHVSARLWCRNPFGGSRNGKTGEEEAELGVPRAPGRPDARLSPASTSVRGGLFGSPCDAVDVIAAAGVCAIALAVIGGLIPAAAGVTLALSVPPAVIDIRERRLPDVWIATALVGLATALAVGAALGHPVDLSSVLSGALAMSAPIIVLHLISPAAMGFGDVKLSIVMGAALGTVDWRLAMVALSAAGLLGATYGLAAGRRTVPFGPFLVVGSLVTLLASGPMLAVFIEAGSSS